MPSSQTNLTTTAVQRHRAREEAKAQGKDPDLVAPKQKPGKKPLDNPSAATLRKRRSRLRKKQAIEQGRVPDKETHNKPRGRPPKTLAEKPAEAMNTLYNLMTGGGNNNPPPTEEEQLHTEMGTLLRQQMQADADQTAIEKQESDRRLLETQNASKLAQAALERERTAQTDAENRKKRREDLGKLFNAYLDSAKKKRPAEEVQATATVVQPSPPRSARKQAARTPDTTTQKIPHHLSVEEHFGQLCIMKENFNIIINN